MIRLEIGTLIFFYILFSVIIILVIWLVSGYNRMKKASRKSLVDYICKCLVCMHTYVDSKNEELSVCPLCGSYNKREVIK